MRRILTGIALALPALAIFPHVVSLPTLRLLLLEDGVVENAAAVLWVLAAVAALRRAWPPDRLMAAYAVVFLVLGMRESDLLSMVPGGGRQALKMSFYLGESGASLPLRLTLALALMLTAWALVVSLWGTLANLRGRGTMEGETLRLLFLGGAVLVCSQLFELAQDWAERLGTWALPVARSCWALEECLEAIAPAIIAYALARRLPASEAAACGRRGVVRDRY